MATRFTVHKNGKPLAPARKIWGDAYDDLRQTSVVKVWPLDKAKDRMDHTGPVSMDFTRGYSIVVTR